MNKEDKELIDEIIRNRMDGDNCIETAECYEENVKNIDTRLYSSLRRLNEAACDMVRRLEELNVELELGHDFDYI